MWVYWRLRKNPVFTGWMGYSCPTGTGSGAAQERPRELSRERTGWLKAADAGAPRSLASLGSRFRNEVTINLS